MVFLHFKKYVAENTLGFYLAVVVLLILLALLILLVLLILLILVILLVLILIILIGHNNIPPVKNHIF